MSGDVHPLPFHRINIILQQYDEFIENYDIKPGDGMYLSPENRVCVW
jgi:predicted metalloendopeptidase